MSNLKIVARLLQYLSPYSGRIVILISLSFLGVIFTVAKPLPIKVIIDYVILEQGLPPQVKNILYSTDEIPSQTQLLYRSLIFMAFITVGGVVVYYINFLLINFIGLNLVFDLSLDLYRKFQALSIDFYNHNKIGDLLQRFNADVFVIHLLVAQIILPVTTSLLALVGMFYIMVLIDPMLAMIAMAVVPLLAILLTLISKPMSNTTKDQYGKQGELSAFVQQSLVSMRVIQAFVREDYMLGKLTERALSFKSAYFRAISISEGYNQTTNLITGLASVVLVGLGAVKGIRGEISPGDIFVFLGYIAALYGPVNSLSTAAGAVIVFGARGKRVFTILDSGDEIPERDDAVDLRVSRGEVIFKNILFGYNRGKPEENLVLKDISFRAEAGKITAIVGSTGAGKTSLISLLSRFHDPWQGQVEIDGNDLKSLRLKSLRENISMVLQDPIIFPVTIADNIAFGNPEASRIQIEEAARLSDAHDFISRLPQGYDTQVSEAGLSLSGGEKQRLSLARAFIMNTPIMVLDEPTSSVDAITEGRIFTRLKQHNQGKTVFVISHRLSTIKNADNILVLKHGRIVEMGTHKELIGKKGIYTALYNQQTID